MKTSTLFFAIIIFLSACSSEKSKIKTENNISFASNISGAPVFKNDFGIEGYYVGYFEASKYDENKDVMFTNKITIAIDSLSESICYGHSVVAGNKRSFKGPYTKSISNLFSVTGKEPGDDRYDGVFIFDIDANSNKITGRWKSNDQNLAVTEREYELERKEFKYDPNLALPEYLTEEGLYGTYSDTSDIAEALTEDIYKVNTSLELLKTKDVENMYQADLEVLRNSIYARHGYSFKNRKMRFLFDHAVDWYMPISVDITDNLTPIEKQNIELIKRYEKHAVKYYDSFGR